MGASISPSPALATNTSDGPSTNTLLSPYAAIPNATSVADGQLGVGEVLALQPEIVDTLASFLEDMKAYKRSFPEPVENRLKELEQMSEAFQALKRTRQKAMWGDDNDDWSCKVRRFNMRHWPEKNFAPELKPKPVIEAYYDDFEEATEPVTNIQSAIQCTEDSLQRVLIKSDILRSEIEKITSVKIRSKLILPPPFKLLVKFYPQIDAHLVTLETDLAGAEVVTQTTKDNLSAARVDGEAMISMQEGPNDTQLANAAAGIVRTQEDNENQRLRSQLRMRIDHLRCLRDFIRSDLHRLITLRKEVENRTLEVISFQDLWFLFSPGDVVLSTRNNSKVLYKIYSVTGGQRRTQVRSSQDRLSRPSIRLRPSPRRINSEDDFSDEDEDLIEEVLHDQLWGVGTWVSLKIDAYSLEFNGKHVGPMNLVKKIKYYEGDIRILDLDVYPVQFDPDKTTLLRQLEERGRNYLKSSGHKSYDGYTVPLGHRDQREELQGDVFVDIETYLQTHTRRIQRFGKLQTSPRESSVNGEELFVKSVKRNLEFTNHEIDVRLTDIFLSSTRQTLALMTPERALSSSECLQLMPSTVPGYAFGLRKWRGLDVDHLSDIDRGREDAGSNFDDLVIPDSFRDMLTALVENHTSRSQRLQARETGIEWENDHQLIDIVRGKGQGLIILLHGPPGSGKTSTAETIAAFTQRPLYSITCGDLGFGARDVEKGLQEHMKKAGKWGCVLLLDEADVFLMQRDWQNVSRNALVSVLLRQLEYYSGILFLTTNRPGVIDEAFISRIHLSLRYPLVDLTATKRMWTNIMNRIERDNDASQIKIVFDRDHLLAFAEKHYLQREKTGMTWNGRQIRNAFQTAIALGTSQRMSMLNKKGITPEQAIASGKRRLLEVKLTRTNFRNITQTARAFEDYMQHLRGNDSDLARQAEVRDDHFDRAAPRATKDYGDRQSLVKLVESSGIVNSPTSTAKSSASAGSARKGPSPKKKNVSGDDDDDGSGSDSQNDFEERSDNSGASDSEDSEK